MPILSATVPGKVPKGVPLCCDGSAHTDVVGAPRGWIEEAGRANLGFDEPPYGTYLSVEMRTRHYRQLRKLEIGFALAGVIAPVIVWLITRKGEATAIAAFEAAFFVLIAVWMYESNRRDIRGLNEQVKGPAESPPPTARTQ